MLIRNRILTALVTAALPTTTAQAAGFGWCGCQNGCMELDIPVPLLTGGTDSVGHTTMYGKLCVPTTGTPSTVVVMFPGATQNHLYFDFTYQPEKYNLRRRLHNAGYSTLLLDPIGRGRSGKPISRRVTATAQSLALHDIITMLRAGDIGGATFTKVILLGHSTGAATVMLEASAYNDTDGIIVAGMAHAPSAEPVITAGFGMFQPAAADAALPNTMYDDGYLTRNPAAAPPPANPDPQVGEQLTRIKDVVTTAETDAFILAMTTNFTTLITAPVMVMAGSADALICSPLTSADCSSQAAFTASEAPFYTGSSAYTAQLVPDSSHDLFLDANATQVQQLILDWLATNGA